MGICISDFFTWLANGKMPTPAEKYLQTAQRGKPRGQLNLGLCYYDGRDVPQDAAEAVRWFKLAARQGLAEAEFYVGRAYATGKGAPKDCESAYAWFERAAEKGHKEAIEWRSILMQEMTEDQIAEGLLLSKESAGRA